MKKKFKTKILYPRARLSRITKRDFEAYEKVRRSGVTNMFDARTVSELSGLTREQIIAIMEHYGALFKQYPDVRELKGE